LASSGEYDETLRLWDASTGACELAFRPRKPADDANFLSWAPERGYLKTKLLAWSPNGRYTALPSITGYIYLWNLHSNDCKPFSEYAGNVRSLSWSADSSSLISTGNDASSKIWNVASGHCEHTLSIDQSQAQYSLDIWCSAVSPNGNWIATAG